MPCEIDPTSRPIDVSCDCSLRISVMSVDISMTASISPAALRIGAVVHSTLIFSPHAEVTTSSCCCTDPVANASCDGQYRHCSSRCL